MTRRPFFELHSTEFEKLLLQICKILLGEAAQSFAYGKDGGRDVRFVGTASSFPSTNDPWKGTIIAQAKHTTKVTASFSDSDFSGDASSSVLAQEYPKIKAMFEEKSLTHYILCSNRSLTGGSIERIIQKISDKTGLAKANIALWGLNDLNDHLNRTPNLMERAGISSFNQVLFIEPQQIAEIIEALTQHKGCIEEASKDARAPKKINFEEKNKQGREYINEIFKETIPKRISFEEKNKLNSFAPNVVNKYRKLYLKNFGFIDSFLSHPLNLEYINQYFDIASDFNSRIAIFIQDDDHFENVIITLYDNLINCSSVCSKNRKLTMTLLFYMYYMCDLGKSK